MNKQSLKEVQDFFSQPLHEELLEAAGISQDEIDDELDKYARLNDKLNDKETTRTSDQTMVKNLVQVKKCNR